MFSPIIFCLKICTTAQFTSCGRWCCILLYIAKTICSCNRGNHIAKPRLLSRRKSCYSHICFFSLLRCYWHRCCGFFCCCCCSCFCSLQIFVWLVAPTSILNSFKFLNSQSYCNFISVFIFASFKFKCRIE